MKHVLVAPLDWGLGHASRCVPIVHELLRRQWRVTLAGNGASLMLLKKEFPMLEAVILPAYDPKYPTGSAMVLKMARQLPKFFSVVRREHTATRTIVRERNIDLIISDNRYGVRCDRVPSVFITHQSNILMPSRFGWMQPWVRRMVHHAMRKFDRCWIPDDPDGLSGALTSFGKMPLGIQAEFIGPLSRFERAREAEVRYDVVAVCSGPEPQRSIFEKKVWAQLQGSGLRFALVRGLPDQQASGNEDVYHFLPAAELKTLMESAAMLITRSGYSTIMDLMALGRAAILVPTPGQTEQEYLARRLLERGICFSMTQNDFDLKVALEEAKNYSGFGMWTNDSARLKRAIDDIAE